MTEEEKDMAAEHVALLLSRLVFCKDCPDRKGQPCENERCPIVRRQRGLDQLCKEKA